MLHKYNVAANYLKTVNHLEAILPQGLKPTSLSRAATKYVYKPIHGNQVAAASSSATAGKKFFKSWKEIPDELIPTTSKRDPHNAIYRHPKYIAFRKKQIFFQQDDGVPLYFREGLKDYILFYSIIVLVTGNISYNLYFWWCQNFK
ncbi:hypothetical protein B4U79_17444 [Dinothrombium tinctorium]|uniref:Uncharacterized protein n=1 Tax=Dinothrombium tinctorium TaxID=1965070 RepID=A0A3S3PM40_9ACAR|nr:hypothetical protein B4U79_17449 [Dinothrombium tinctorium]RWS12577.1 hypothetical protein B4U79_17444 [Dinothrombium tinctorium]